MIHPDTELKLVSPVIGYGVFATRPIPAGTIVYVRDALELAIPPDSAWMTSPHYRDIIEKYAYIDPGGNHIISWDLGKYVNHNCHANTLSTGYGFEIAVRDIRPGEEVTDDYGLFNMTRSFPCACGEAGCRGEILGSDVHTHADHYDRLAELALSRYRDVDQPLASYVDGPVHLALERYFVGQESMWTVRRLAAETRRSAGLVML